MNNIRVLPNATKRLETHPTDAGTIVREGAMTWMYVDSVHDRRDDVACMVAAVRPDTPPNVPLEISPTCRVTPPSFAVSPPA